jgi:hypothetical protein
MRATQTNLVTRATSIVPQKFDEHAAVVAKRVAETAVEDNARTQARQIEALQIAGKVEAIHGQ